MKKKVSLILCILTCALLVAGCNVSLTKQNKNFNEKKLEQLESAIEYYDGMKDSLSEDEWNSYLEQRKTAQEQIKEYKEAVKQKKKFGDEMDKKISTDFTVSSTSATVNETIRTTKGKTFIYSVSYDKDGNKTEEKIDEYKTMGAKMVKAGINTILSMAIVFCVLIFISLIIACFKVIGWAQNRKNAKQVDKAKAQLASVETAPQPVEENLVDDLELVAVITAAIAASENASADGLVVRSIIRR